MYPIFITGWVADCVDPHNFLSRFMHSQGNYGRYMAYRNAEVDRLCDAGIVTMDPQEHEKIHTRFQHLWYEEAVGIPLYQQINIRAYRDWVQGYVPNAMLTDAWEDLKQMVKR